MQTKKKIFLPPPPPDPHLVVQTTIIMSSDHSKDGILAPVFRTCSGSIDGRHLVGNLILCIKLENRLTF